VGFAGQATLIAIGIGLTVAICEASAVEFAKETHGLVRIGFIVLFCASMLYIISNTMFVYYKAYNELKIERELRNAKVIDNNSVEARQYRSELEKYTTQKDTLQKEIALIDSTISGIPANYVTRRQQLLDRREKASNELNVLTVPVEPQTTKMTTEQTAWELLAEVLHTDPDALSMIFLALPAVIADIASPLFFCMFFGRRKRKSEPKPEQEKQPEPEPAPEKNKEKKPSLNDIMAYIDSAMRGDKTLLPDEEVSGMSRRKSATLREYLMSFFYKGKPIFYNYKGNLKSIFDNENLKKFIALQYDVQRKENTA
jgi:hypothetical protein